MFLHLFKIVDKYILIFVKLLPIIAQGQRISGCLIGHTLLANHNRHLFTTFIYWVCCYDYHYLQSPLVNTHSDWVPFVCCGLRKYTFLVARKSTRICVYILFPNLRPLITFLLRWSQEIGYQRIKHFRRSMWFVNVRLIIH